MNRILILIPIAFVLGFFTNRFLSKSPTADGGQDSTALQCEKLSDAKSNLISISQNEYIEYTKIKDLKQKYEKADEILGKVMLLFLADIGFRLQKPVTIVTEPTVQSAAVEGSPAASAETTQTDPVETQPQNAEPQTTSSLSGRSTVIRMLSTERQIREALDKAVIENPKTELTKGLVPSQKQIRTIEGRYSGVVRFFDGKRENLTVTWDLLPDYTKSGISGTFTLRIHGPGMNSESSRNGDIDDIVSIAEDRDGLLVYACGNECFFQLYYNSPSDQFYGNYYQMVKGSKVKSERLGLVELKK